MGSGCFLLILKWNLSFSLLALLKTLVCCDGWLFLGLFWCVIGVVEVIMWLWVDISCLYVDFEMDIVVFLY